jgi:hypothetical protein
MPGHIDALRIPAIIGSGTPMLRMNSTMASPRRPASNSSASWVA